MGVCNCSMFCYTLLYVHFSIAIILMGKRELIALLNLSSWCLVMVERLFLTVPQGCLQFVIVVFPDHTHLLFLAILLIWVFQDRSFAMSTPRYLALATSSRVSPCRVYFVGREDVTWLCVLPGICWGWIAYPMWFPILGGCLGPPAIARSQLI